MNRLIRLFKIFFSIDYIFLIKMLKVIITKNYSKYPPYVEEFENEISKKFSIKNVLSFSSGSAAFYASLLALNLPKKSKVLISCMTFPTIINLLKKMDFEIYYFELNKKFQPINDTDLTIKFDLLIITHPFGFYTKFEDLKNLLKKECKIIYDSSNSHGLLVNSGKIDHIKEADISFFSIQGNKSISGGEGGVALTDDDSLYEKMIINHHPGHRLNVNKNIAGSIVDLKLRMHPFAAYIGLNDLKTFETRNNKLKKKIVEIYNFFDRKNIKHPYDKKNDISGFHYGLPFFYDEQIKDEIIKEYNWYADLRDKGIRPINNSDNLSIINQIYFLDLNFVKENNLKNIFNKLNFFFNDN